MKIPSRARGGGVDDISFEQLITRENLLRAWQKFSRGKWRQGAVREFWLCLEAELDLLYHDLSEGVYAHGEYHHFVRYENKKRDIYVASVRDRVVHQALADYLEKRFALHFIAHSYAAQKGKGVAAARDYIFGVMRRLRCHHKVWVAKLDVEKYFANVNHTILMQLLMRRVHDTRILQLCQTVVNSFGSECQRGMPLGNLTSQWFANIYLHELDWYAKQTLGIRYYMRYNDDSMLVGTKETEVRRFTGLLVHHAKTQLYLQIPAHKVEVVAVPGASVDVLGVCTNGTRRWIRPTTACKAKRHLMQCMYWQCPHTLDTMCSYFGSGIAYMPQEAM